MDNFINATPTEREASLLRRIRQLEQEISNDYALGGAIRALLSEYERNGKQGMDENINEILKNR